MASLLRKSLICALLLLCAASADAYERIVSLYAGHTDNIIALGGGARLVGITKNDEPARLPHLTRFPTKTGAESILAVRPDLVLMRSFTVRHNPEMKDVLERAGVTVVLIDPPSWDGFPDYLRKLAPLIDVSPENAVKQFRQDCDNLRAEALRRKNGAPEPSVFIEATSKELHTCSPSSWSAHLVELAGGHSAAEGAEPARKGSSVAPWGLERILKLAAGGLDVYLVQHGPMNMSTAEDVKQRPWAAALKNTKIAQIPEYALSRPSLIGLKEGGRMLLEIFYGE